MKKGTLQLLAMIVGTLLTVAIVFAQITTSERPTEKAQTEQSTSDNEAKAFISLPSFSLPAPVTLSSSLENHFIFEIVFEETEAEQSESFRSALPRKLFTTLFRVIISPNAP